MCICLDRIQSEPSLCSHPFHRNASLLTTICLLARQMYSSKSYKMKKKGESYYMKKHFLFFSSNDSAEWMNKQVDESIKPGGACLSLGCLFFRFSAVNQCDTLHACWLVLLPGFLTALWHPPGLGCYLPLLFFPFCFA